jgi:hypothetical protein
MPNGRPGDHHLTDIIIHRIPTYSRRADALVRKLAKLISHGILWDFLYLLTREGKMIRIEGTERRLTILEFEQILADLLASTEALAAKFKSAERRMCGTKKGRK